MFLLLCANLDDTDVDQDVLERVLSCCLEQLDLEHQVGGALPAALLLRGVTGSWSCSQEVKEMATRSKRREVQLIVMRFLSVLLSRTKSASKGAAQVCCQSSLYVVSQLCVPSVRFMCPSVRFVCCQSGLCAVSPVCVSPVRFVCRHSGLCAVSLVFLPAVGVATYHC